ncbi:MAG: chaperone NapD [Rhodocyclaceae bacterium]
MIEEVHITSLVVHAAPKRAAAIGQQIADMAGAEVHAVSAAGKLVVTLEADSSRAIMDAVSAIQRLDGVMSAALVYQHADSLEAMNEECDEASTEEKHNELA